jgi:NTE family protein
MTPFWYQVQDVVVTDFSSGEPVIVSEGDAVTALLASSTFPGLYPPVACGSRLFVDGGVSADVPIAQAEALGATVSYVLPAAGIPQSHSSRGPLSVAFRALSQVLDRVTRRDMAAARGQLHMVPAPISYATNPIDFRRTRALVGEGYRLASQWLSRADVPAVSFAGAPAMLGGDR